MVEGKTSHLWPAFDTHTSAPYSLRPPTTLPERNSTVIVLLCMRRTDFELRQTISSILDLELPFFFRLDVLKLNLLAPFFYQVQARNPLLVDRQLTLLTT